MLPEFLTAGSTRRPSCVVRVVFAIASAILLVSGLTSAPAKAQSSDGHAARVTLETRPAAALANAVDAGPLPASQRLTLTLTLASTPGRSAALSQFLTDLTTSSSPHYRKWITPVQFASVYGATAAQLTAATQWAQAHGLTVESSSPANTRIVVSGFASQIEPLFAVSLHAYTVNGGSYFAGTQQPSLTADAAALFSAIDGLDNLPATSSLMLAGKATSFLSVTQLIDANATPILSLSSGLCPDGISASQLAEYTLLFQQAAAQGITTLSTRTCASGGFPSALAEVTAVALAGDAAETAAPVAARPSWQAAPGLPSDAFRHAPDLTASSLSALASTLSSIAVTMPSGRLGDINPVLYQLAPTPGLYDQDGNWQAATGLGLVDLDKLAKAFPRGTGSSFVSLNANTYSLAFGQPLTFTSTVTSGTGGPTPTGTVSYVTTSGTVVCGPASEDGGGNTTCTTTTLAPGSYQIVASYSGDGTYAPATSSPPAGITVQPATASFSATVSSGNVVGGTFTVVVTVTVPGSAPQPTGSVILNISGTSSSYTQALVGATANTSTATFTEPADTVGTLTLNATCANGSNFNCPNPLTTNVTVAKATPTMAISYSPNPPVSGQSITLNATVSPVGTAPVPTGSVTFYDNSTVLNSNNLNNGTISIGGTVPTTSTHKITATYNGDPNYNPVTTAGTTNGTTATSTTLTSAATTVTSGQSFNLTVKVTPSTVVNSVQPTGAVQILDGGSVIASGAVTAGSATVPVSLTTTGANSLTADYLGDANYVASTSPAVSVTVNATGSVSTTTTITPSTYTAAYGQPFTITSTVKASSTVNNTAPAGTVTFSLLNGTVLAAVPLSNGTAIYTPTTPLNTGAYVFVAAYSGDANYAGSYSPGSGTVSVNPAVATISATDSPTSVAANGSTTVTATVSLPSSSFAPTGAVTVTVPGVAGAVYSGNLTASGTNTAVASISVPAPPGGTYALQVACAGTANFSCTPTTVALTSTAPGKIATTTTLSLSPATPTSGQTVMLTATVVSVTSGASPISGTVAFFVGGAQVGTGMIANGLATTNYTVSGSSMQTFSAVYSGDTLYASSTSAGVSINTALVPSTTTLSSSATSGVTGGNITLTAQVKGTATGGASPTGKVSFYLVGTTPSLLGTAMLSANGTGSAVATFNTTAIPSGTHQVYAVYSGDSVFNASTSGNISIGLSDYTLSFSPATLTLTGGETRSVTLTVTPTGGFAGDIDLTCAPPPSLSITCSLTPSVLNGGGTSTLLISTVAAKKSENHVPGFKAIGGVALAGLLCLLLPGDRRRRRLPALLLVLLAAGLTVNLGCSSSGSTPSNTGTGGTPLGTIDVEIYTGGTSGSQSVHHDFAYQVTVQ